jgi:prepilin-type N-terminal cleavage/methylation domain-containing protein/prepilin-type processing-associated H-X9-DG protein
MRRQGSGFTVIELLVVIAIIGVVAALLFPLFSRARASARRAMCGSNMRQITLAAFIYTQDHDEVLPSQPMVPGDPSDGQPIRAIGGTGANYYDATLPYVKSPPLWLCPSTTGDGYMAYHMNGLLITPAGLGLAALSEPARTLFLVEGAPFRRWDKAYLRPNQEGGNSFDGPIGMHPPGANAALADGHVKWYHNDQWNGNYLREGP